MWLRRSTSSTGSERSAKVISLARSHTGTTTANYAHLVSASGNGRSTREFFDLLLSERGSGLDWGKTDLEELHGACHVARANSDLTGLVAMFAGSSTPSPLLRLLIALTS